jgi:hypothetical protein
MTFKNAMTAITILSLTVLSLTLFVTVGNVYAHSSANLVINSNANHTIVLTLGEQSEPVYPDTTSGAEFIVKDFLTQLPITNVQKQQGVVTSTAPTKLFMDEYFYPKGTSPSLVHLDNSGGVVAIDLDGSNVKAGPGYVDSHIKTNVGATFGKPGYYSGDVLLYTETGRTLYHVYGDMNYFNDTSVKVNFWNDGGTTKLGRGGQLTSGAGTNSTLTFGSSFGEKDKTTQYWPGASAGINNATHPVSVPAAVGKGGDIWSFLKSITTAINSITGGATVTPATAP